MRLTKFKDEHRLDFAWVGNPERIVAIVGQDDAPTKPDNTPDPVAIESHPHGMRPASTTARRILAIGTGRW